MTKHAVLILTALFLSAASVASVSSTQALGDAYAKGAKEAILMDGITGDVLYEKNPDAMTHPSSMTKIMTVYLAFKRLKEGRITLEDTFPVSTKAWKTGGSRMFVEPNTQVALPDLIRGIAVQSGNDASIVLAEGLGGTEENFALEMTETAQALGAKNTSFRNAHGLSEPGHYSTVRDLAIIAQSMMKNFPLHFPYFAEKSFTYNKIKQPNRNPILYAKGFEPTGLKTGVTDEGGYGLVATAKKEGRNLVLVVNGVSSQKERAVTSEQLLNWGFREFENIKVAQGGTEIIKANTWLGESPTLSLMIGSDVTVTVERSKRHQIKVEAVYKGPIEAPIQSGQVLGTLQIQIPGRPIIEKPLMAAHDVKLVSPIKRIVSAIHYLIWGHG